IADPFEAPICSEPVAQEALNRRTAYLNGRRSELYQLAQYVVLLYEPASRAKTATRLERIWRRPADAFRDWLQTQRTLQLLQSELDATILALHHRAESFESQLADLGLKRLPQAETFRFFRQLVNYDPAVLCATPVATPDVYLDYFVADSAVDCHRDHL